MENGDDLLRQGVFIVDDNKDIVGFMHVINTETVHIKPVVVEMFQEILTNKPPKDRSLDRIKRKTKKYF